MELSTYFAYVTISFFTIVSPGAAILLAINNGLFYNTKAVFLSTLGNALGLFILSCVAMFAVGSLLLLSATFFTILKITGACYLIYLGIKQIMNKNLHIQLQKGKQYDFNPFKVFQKGFLVAITNPKPILFFSAVFPLFLDNNKNIINQFFIMTFTFIAISFFSLMFYGSLSKAMQKWFMDFKKLRIFQNISGLLFITMGAGLLFLEEKR